MAASVSCALAVLFQAAGRVAALSRDVLSVTTLLAFLLSRTIALPGSSNVGGIHHCK